MTQNEMLKIAYARGVAAAMEDSGLVKEAIIGQALGWAGRGIAKGIGKALGSSKATKQLMRFGKGGTKGSLLGGTFTGGMGALAAPEGERGEAFARAFLPGAIGFGPGWQLSSRLGRLAAKRGVSAAAGGGAKGLAATRNIMRRSNSKLFTKKRISNLWRGKDRQLRPPQGGPDTLVNQFRKNPVEGMKTVGSKVLMGGLPFGTAMLGSAAASAPAEALLQKTPQTMSTPAAAAIYHTGRQAMGRGYGATPQAQYPRNYGYYGQYQ